MSFRSALVFAAVTLVAPIAHADRDKAAAAYKHGAADFARGAFPDAAAEFDSAFAEDPRGASAYNAALSWQSAHDDARAADDFARAIAAGDLGDALLANANAQLIALEVSLGRLSLGGAASVHYAVAHASGPPPAVVHLAPGHYVVHATFGAGPPADFPVDIVSGAERHLDLAPPPPPPRPAPPEVVRRRGAFGSATLPIGVAATALGVVAGGFAIGVGVATLDALDAYEATGYTSPSAHDHATGLRDWANVAFVSAIVLGGAGIALLATVHRVHVRAALGPGSVVVRGTF